MPQGTPWGTMPGDGSDDFSAFTVDSAFENLLQRVAGDSGPSDRDVVETFRARYADHPRFQFLESLGVGGFGAVFLVEDRRLGDRVALKMLHAAGPRAIYRFKQEFRLLQQVVHPGLVRLFQLYCEGGQWFFTMEWLPGRDLLDPLDARPLLPQFMQLGEALMHLHGQGLLHLDLKPSNVRVTDEGRVVLLDFGLARVSTDGGQVRAGTPGYMAPEQRRGETASPATDWYAVGVMLFQALTGRRPLPGDPRFDGVDRSDPEVARLVTLCEGLLESDPSDRPDEGRIAELLGIEPPRPAVVSPRPQEASRAAGLGSGTVVAHSPEGQSNRHWLASLAAELSSSGSLVLQSRCRVQESIAFRAFDELVDGLAQALMALDPVERGGIWPRDTAALVALFPAFARALDTKPAGTMAGPELRQRGFFAFRELLGRLVRSRPVAILVDDVQWMDADSVLPLLGLVDPPVSLPILLVVTCRTRGDLTPSMGPAAPLLQWARNPLILSVESELRPAIREVEQGAVPSPELIEVYGSALALLAAARQPLELGVAQRALPAFDFSDAVVRGLLRWETGDRLDFASAEWAATARELEGGVEAHRSLAAALGPGADPVRLSGHCAAGGQPDEARNGLLSSANQAFEDGRFQAACRCFGALDALQLRWDDADREWRWRWAQSLARVGHCGQAGALARILAPRLTPDRRAMVSLHAAQWLLASGEVDAGLQLAGEVLRPLGVRLPTTRIGRMVAFVEARARSRQPVPTLEPVSSDPSERRAAEASWNLGLRIASMDLLQGAHLLSHHLDLAARGGAAGAYGRGLAVEAVMRSVLGTHEPEALIRRAEELVQESGDRRSQGGLLLARAMTHVFAGAFGRALEACDRADPYFAVSGSEGVQDAILLQGLRQMALYWTGRLDELRRVYLRGADLHRSRGDRFARVHLTTQFGWLAPLLVDDLQRAQTLLAEADEVWSTGGYQTQRLTLTLARVNALLYAGQVEEAAAMVASEHRAIQRSGLLLVAAHRLRWNGLHCRVLMASIEAGGSDPRAGRDLHRRLKMKRWQGVVWAGGIRRVLLGRLQAASGDTEGAIATLLEAEEELGSHGLEGIRQSARWRRGHLMGGERGEELVQDAERFFSGQGCVRAARWAQWIA